MSLTGFNKYASRAGLRCNIDRFDERSVEPHFAGARSAWTKSFYDADAFRRRALRRVSRAGRCDQVCTHCGALHWKAEQPSSGNYKTCCNGGNLNFPTSQNCRPTSNRSRRVGRDSKKFLNDARYYGNAMASARPRPLAPTICICARAADGPPPQVRVSGRGRQDVLQGSRRRRRPA